MNIEQEAMMLIHGMSKASNDNLCKVMGIKYTDDIQILLLLDVIRLILRSVESPYKPSNERE